LADFRANGGRLSPSAQVYFAQAQQDELWTDFLGRQFLLTPEGSLELRNLGALYLNQKRWLPGPDFILKKHDIVRVHLKPRRFPLQFLMSQEPFVHLEKDWALMWKPSGLPSHETLDNTQENAKAWLENHLQCRLWSLSRLDIGTRGWLIFARGPEFARTFHLKLQNQKVRKVYEALSLKAPAHLGIYRHWMRKSPRAPKLISDLQELPNDQLCELSVLKTHQGPNFACSRIELITGRTHQIRAQFAKIGSPILGDHLYGSPNEAKGDYEQFALSCEQLTFNMDSRTYQFDRPSQIDSLTNSWTCRTSITQK